MTTAAYPLTLRTILQAQKSRSQPAAFSVNQPRRGRAFKQAIGTDVPVFWDVVFRFTQAEALVFRVWFEGVINRGLDDFTMPIRTEFGMVTHTCSFLDGNLLDTSETGDLFTFKATIMARAQVIPDGYLDAADLITTLPDWTTWAQYLDQAVNARIPQ